MITALSIPEITISPTDLCGGMQGETLFTWQMRAYKESTLDSYDHGDVFDSVEEALANAYAEFNSLAEQHHLIPAKIEQKFKITIRQTTTVKPAHLYSV